MQERSSDVTATYFSFSLVVSSMSNSRSVPIRHISRGPMLVAGVVAFDFDVKHDDTCRPGDEIKFWTSSSDQRWHSGIQIAAACQTQRDRYPGRCNVMDRCRSLCKVAECDALSLFALVECGNVLVIAQDAEIWMDMQSMVEKIHQKGHKVVLVIPKNNVIKDSSQGFSVKMYAVPFLEPELNMYMEHAFDQPLMGTLLSAISTESRRMIYTASVLSLTCSHLLDDQVLIHFLQRNTFDVAIMDPFFPCGPILAEQLHLRSIYFLPKLPCDWGSRAMRCPDTNDLNHVHGFMERIKSQLLHSIEHLTCEQIKKQFTNLASKFLHKEVKLLELFSQAEIFFYKYDHVLELPKPFMPNMVFIGGHSCGRKQKLDKDGSHWLSMRSVVEKLSEKGHQIVIIVPEVNFQLKNIDNYTVRTWHVSYTKEFMESFIKDYTNDVFEQKTFLQNMDLTYRRVMNSTKLIVAACENLLKNETLINYLNVSNFDAMLSDPVFPCGEIIAEYLSIPSIFFMRGALFSVEQAAAQSPSPPSYVPRFFTTYTDHMTFYQRVINFLLASIESTAYNQFYSAFVPIASNFLHRDITVLDLFSHASIILFRIDFVLDFPRPVMPNMVFIGGINCANKKPLNQCVHYPLTGIGRTIPSDAGSPALMQGSANRRWQIYLRYRHTKRRCSDTDNDADRCSVAGELSHRPLSSDQRCRGPRLPALTERRAESTAVTSPLHSVLYGRPALSQCGKLKARDVTRHRNDNDTKHTSRLCKGYLTKKESDGVLHQMTWPLQSLDLNPIEMVWASVSLRPPVSAPAGRKAEHSGDVTALLSGQHLHNAGKLTLGDATGIKKPRKGGKKTHRAELTVRRYTLCVSELPAKRNDKLENKVATKAKSTYLSRAAGHRKDPEAQIQHWNIDKEQGRQNQVELNNKAANELTRTPERGSSEAAVPLVTTGVNSATEFTTVPPP
ncbi:unnamed protein product [Ranitomeya imitator]|uniref:Uncharacterized protein n=1 Tax=Ranitomeya imitator TaxID=111125 RepID=A0ABN9MI61_9NEOB|nr:unnamed protein product [Ranitomeya imitator]